MHKYIAPPSVDMIVSDHFAISCDFCFEKPKYETREISYRKLDNIDMNGLETIYAKFHAYMTWPPGDIDTIVQDFNAALIALLERHAPKKTRNKKIRSLDPKFNECIHADKKEKRRYERIWLKRDR